MQLGCRFAFLRRSRMKGKECRRETRKQKPFPSCLRWCRGPRQGGGEPPGVCASLAHWLPSPPAPTVGHVAAQGAPAQGVLRLLNGQMSFMNVFLMKVCDASASSQPHTCTQSAHGSTLLSAQSTMSWPGQSQGPTAAQDRGFSLGRGRSLPPPPAGAGLSTSGVRTVTSMLHDLGCQQVMLSASQHVSAGRCICDSS
jgi:hypothetical protein